MSGESSGIASAMKTVNEASSVNGKFNIKVKVKTMLLRSCTAAGEGLKKGCWPSD